MITNEQQDTTKTSDDNQNKDDHNQEMNIKRNENEPNIIYINKTENSNDYNTFQSENEEDEMQSITIDPSNDKIVNILAMSGPTSKAAAAAINSTCRKRKRPYQFETNPSVRKRQYNRLMRKLRCTMEEYSTRCGQQAVVVIATPGRSSNFKVFGAQPLQDVVKNLRHNIVEELEVALDRVVPEVQTDPSLFELPPLVIDGVPTPIDKMTQAQLRAFIPMMLKYSTGRGKPGWGQESTRPPWWPTELPWANVRMDARTDDDKSKISWTHALRQIVINCYKYHGREDLLNVYQESKEEYEEIEPKPNEQANKEVDPLTPSTSKINNNTNIIQTISNNDGSITILQVDPNTEMITMPDGNQIPMQNIILQQNGINFQTVSTENSSQQDQHIIDFNALDASINENGQLVLTDENGQGYIIDNVLTVPMQNASGEQVSNSGAVCMAPGGGGLILLPSNFKEQQEDVKPFIIDVTSTKTNENT